MLELLHLSNCKIATFAKRLYILFIILIFSFDFNYCLFSNEKNKILLGIDVLEANNFSILHDKRIGLLTHPAGVNNKGISTIKIFTENKKINCVALFGPEHGIYGDEKANQTIKDRIDPTTGLKVYSLYGEYRKPRPYMLSKIDTLVIDLQDIGVRSYTYISCMLYAIEACFEEGVEVIILDRPNPLGGRKVNGPILEKKFKSYVGAFPIPYVHGLTIGELAILSKEMPDWMSISDDIREKGRLKIIKMKGWNRDMIWPSTGLEWIPTSPNIPSFTAAVGYAMTGLGAQEGGFSHGIGTSYPFRLLSHELLASNDLLNLLKAYNIEGAEFKIVKTNNSRGLPINGIYVGINNWEKLNLTELSFYMMHIAWKIENENPFLSSSRPLLFNKHVGSSSWWNELNQNKNTPNVEKFLKDWEISNMNFKKKVQKYLIYK